jgi:hypothetical protein
MRSPYRGSSGAQRARQHPARFLLLAASAAGLARASACLCPPAAEDLIAVGYRTPRQTLASFQTFLRADLPMQEYLCFSAGFRRRNGISAATYSEARERLFEEQPWIKLVAKAQVAGEKVVSEDEHWIDAEVLGRTVRVKLVREAFFEILAGERRLADDYADFGSLVRVESEGGEALLTARIPFEAAQDDLAGLSEVQIASHWKIDELYELDDESPRLPPPDAPQPPT